MKWVGQVARMARGDVYTGFWLGKADGTPPGKQSVDGRIILRWIFRKWNVRDWIDVTQDRDRWRALVNAVMNLRVQ